MTARKPDHPLSTAKKRSAPTQSSRRAGKLIEAAIAEFLLDRESQNYSPKTLKWHKTALAHLAAFLEEHHQVTHLSMLEPVHLRAWMVFLEKEPGAKGKPRVARTCRWYAHIKAGVITSRLRIGRPGKTNSKEQKIISAGRQTPTKLCQDQVTLSPTSKRRLPNTSRLSAGSSRSYFR